MFHQQPQDSKGLWAERNRPVALPQAFIPRIEPESTKGYVFSGLHHHSAPPSATHFMTWPEDWLSHPGQADSHASAAPSPICKSLTTTSLQHHPNFMTPPQPPATLKLKLVSSTQPTIPGGMDENDQIQDYLSHRFRA
jgi:hypothetical protein